MTDRRLFQRDATDHEVAITALSQILGVTIEEAARIFEEEGDTPIPFWESASRSDADR